MPSDKKTGKGKRKEPDNRQKRPYVSSKEPAVPSPDSPFFSSSMRHSPSRRNAVISVEDIKSRAFRTEDLTQRAHRFIFQLAIDLREKLQSEFDALEKFSADPKSSVHDLKSALISLSNKIASEIAKQMEVQRKIADAYETMFHEARDMAKQVLVELDTGRLSLAETEDAARLLANVMDVIRETVDFWSSRPHVSQTKLNELKRNAPRETMNLGEMLELLDFQVKHCHKALEHPMGGAVSISKEFAKLNINRKTK